MTPAGQVRVLITGACRGIGRACAEQFAARGVQLILADNDASALSELAQQLGATGRYCDVASEASVAAVSICFNSAVGSTVLPALENAPMGA